jgi:hypothetical protein
MRIGEEAEMLILDEGAPAESILDADPVLAALQKEWFTKANQENEIMGQYIPNEEAREHAAQLNADMSLLQKAIEKRVAEILMEGIA